MPAEGGMTIVRGKPDAALDFTVIERIVEAEARPPQPPQKQPTAISKAQTPEPAVASATDPDRILREAPTAKPPDILQPSHGSEPQKETPTTVHQLPLTTILERSTGSEPARAAPAESPSHISAKRVTPAPEQRPPLQPQHVQASKNNTPPVQVSIGTIDLRINPSESTRRQAPRRRRQPQGFDGFRQRRSYSGWEN
jgi:hypothetical protein